MSRTLTAAMQSALARAENQIILLAEIGTDSTPIRAWTGGGDLVFNGNIFSGVGEFGSVSEIEETTEIAARGISFGLSGIPTSLLSSALQDMRQGRTAKLWFGIVKNRILDNYVNNGFFDSDITGWTDSSTVDASISWNANGYLDLIETASGEAVADQQLSGLTASQEYYIALDLIASGASGIDVLIGTTQGASNISNVLAKAGEKIKIIFTPGVTNPWIRLQVNGITTNGTVTVDNVVVLENLPVPLLSDPVLLWQGAVDTVGIFEGAETSSITVNGENRLIRLEITNERRFTKQDQDSIVSGDKGFDYVVGLQEKEIKWGRS